MYCKEMSRSGDRIQEIYRMRDHNLTHYCNTQPDEKQKDSDEIGGQNQINKRFQFDQSGMFSLRKQLRFYVCVGKTDVAVGFSKFQVNPPSGMANNGVCLWSAVSWNTPFPHQFISLLLGKPSVKKMKMTPITLPLSNALVRTQLNLPHQAKFRRRTKYWKKKPTKNHDEQFMPVEGGILETPVRITGTETQRTQDLGQRRWYIQKGIGRKTPAMIAQRCGWYIEPVPNWREGPMRPLGGFRVTTM